MRQLVTTKWDVYPIIENKINLEHITLLKDKAYECLIMHVRYACEFSLNLFLVAHSFSVTNLYVEEACNRINLGNLK